MAEDDGASAVVQTEGGDDPASAYFARYGRNARRNRGIVYGSDADFGEGPAARAEAADRLRAAAPERLSPPDYAIDEEPPPNRAQPVAPPAAVAPAPAPPPLRLDPTGGLEDAIGRVAGGAQRAVTPVSSILSDVAALPMKAATWLGIPETLAHPLQAAKNISDVAVKPIAKAVATPYDFLTEDALPAGKDVARGIGQAVTEFRAGFPKTGARELGGSLLTAGMYAAGALPEIGAVVRGAGGLVEDVAGMAAHGLAPSGRAMGEGGLAVTTGADDLSRALDRAGNRGGFAGEPTRYLPPERGSRTPPELRLPEAPVAPDTPMRSRADIQAEETEQARQAALADYHAKAADELEQNRGEVYGAVPDATARMVAEHRAAAAAAGGQLRGPFAPETGASPADRLDAFQLPRAEAAPPGEVRAVNKGNALQDLAEEVYQGRDATAHEAEARRHGATDAEIAQARAQGAPPADALAPAPASRSTERRGAVGDLGPTGGSGSPLKRVGGRPAVEHAAPAPTSGAVAKAPAAEEDPLHVRAEALARQRVEAQGGPGWDDLEQEDVDREINGAMDDLQAGTAEPLDRVNEPVAKVATGGAFGSRLYSRLGQAINDSPFQKGTAEQWKAHLSKGVPSSERSHVGLDAFLEENKGKVLTRDEVAGVYNQGRVQLGEVTLGQPHPNVDKIAQGTKDLDRLESQRTFFGWHQVPASQRQATTGWRVEELRSSPYTGQREVNIYDPKGTLVSQRSGTRLTDDDLIHELITGRTREGEGVPVFTLDDAFDVAKDQHAGAPPRAAVEKVFGRSLTKEEGAWLASWNAKHQELQGLEDEMQAAPKSSGEPRFPGYVEPGGENYREHVITLEGSPDRAATRQAHADEDAAFRALTQHLTENKDFTQQGAEQYARDAVRSSLSPAQVRAIDPAQRALIDRAQQTYTAAQQAASGVAERTYQSSHWPGIDNPLVHVRTTDRVLPSGEKALFLEEVQSDWHQQGRKQGYADPSAQKRIDALDKERQAIEDDRVLNKLDEKDAPPEVIERWTAIKHEIRKLEQQRDSGIPDAPLKKTSEWTELGVKKAIDLAVKEGKDRIVWTTGDQQAARYDLSKQVDELTYEPERGRLLAQKDGHVVHSGQYDAKALPDVIGKEAAEKLLATPRESGWTATPAAKGTGFEIRDPGGRLQETINAGSAEEALLRASFRNNSVHRLSGVDLKVGGEGMKAYYDKLLPKVVKDYGKKLGVKLEVEPVKVTGAEVPAEDWEVFKPTTGETVQRFATSQEAADYVAAHPRRDLDYSQTKRETNQNLSFKVTPALKAAVLQKGQPLGFSHPAVVRTVAGAALGALAGATQGDTPEDRATYALLGFLGGGIAGAVVSRAVSRFEATDRALGAIRRALPTTEAQLEPTRSVLDEAPPAVEAKEPVKSSRGLWYSRTTEGGTLRKPEEMETEPLIQELHRRADAQQVYHKDVRRYGPASVVTQRNEQAIFTIEKILEDRDGLKSEDVWNEIGRRRGVASGEADFGFGANVSAEHGEPLQFETYAPEPVAPPAKAVPAFPPRGPTEAGGAEARLLTVPFPLPEAAGLAARHQPVTMERVKRGLVGFFNPMALSTEATATGGVIRGQGAKAFRNQQVILQRLHAASKLVGTLSKSQSVALWDAAEHWNEPGMRERVAKIDPRLPGIVELNRKVSKGLEKTLIDMGILHQTVANYVGRFWAGKAKGEPGAAGGIRHVEGAKSFAKERLYDNFTDGLADHAVPITYNFIDAQALKYEEMGKAIAGRTMVALEEAGGRGKWVPIGAKELPKDPETGVPWVKVGDGKSPAFTMYKGPDSREAIGHYYAPADVAQVWHNFLTPGPQHNPLFAAMLIPGRFATQLLLGVSGFHAVNVGQMAAFSELASGVESAVHGDVKDAIKAVARAPMSPLNGLGDLLKQVPSATGAATAREIRAEYLQPGAFPAHAPVLDAMLDGGYRFSRTSEFLKGDRVDAFKTAFRDAIHGATPASRLWGATKAIPNAISAAMEAAATPVMGKYVPLQKLYATYIRVAQELKDLPAGTTHEQMAARMGDVVDEMDYRFGQVIYENHFVNNAAKDIAQLLLLAPGWTFGTLALGRRALSKQKSAAFWTGAFAGTAFLNGATTYALTGEMPHGADYLAFRDGTVDEDGNPNRHTLPGYIMGDAYGWTHHPVETAGHKLNPGPAWAYSWLTNKNYWGDEIYNPADPTLTQLKQTGKSVAGELIPISIQNALEGRKRGESGAGEMARDFLGIKPAKREVQRTAAQNLIAEITARHRGVKTPEEEADARVRGEINLAWKEGGRAAAVEVARTKMASGELTDEQVARMRAPSSDPPLVRKFNSLSLPDAARVYAAGTAQERALWAPILAAKRRRAGLAPLAPAAAGAPGGVP